jgi:hypothetical protein
LFDCIPSFEHDPQAQDPDRIPNAVKNQRIDPIWPAVLRKKLKSFSRPCEQPSDSKADKHRFSIQAKRVCPRQPQEEVTSHMGRLSHQPVQRVQRQVPCGKDRFDHRVNRCCQGSAQFAGGISGLQRERQYEEGENHGPHQPDALHFRWPFISTMMSLSSAARSKSSSLAAASICFCKMSMDLSKSFLESF